MHLISGKVKNKNIFSQLQDFNKQHKHKAINALSKLWTDKWELSKDLPCEIAHATLNPY